MKNWITTILGCLLVVSTWAQERPNILLITDDDMNWNSVGVYNSTITGIPPERLTMAELFQEEGYATACIGKWHLGFNGPNLPKAQGFDHYYGILHNLDSWEVAHYEEEEGTPLLRNGKVVLRNPDPGTLTKLYTEEAIAWMEKRVSMESGKSASPNSEKLNEPFFLYLPHTMLHHPMGVSPEFEGSSNWGLYGDAIQELDYYGGRIVDALERLGIAEETILIYASDNGRRGGRNDQQPIRGAKLTTYEGGLRVPCIAYWPGVIQKGVEANAVIHAMDWYPTLASLAGIIVPEDLVLDGRDLSALLAGKTNKVPAFEPGISLNATIPLRRKFFQDREWENTFTRDEYLNAFFYHGSHGSLAAVRSGKWKLSLHPDLKLYDLERDPFEHVPVDNQDVKRKLRGMVIQFQREMNQYM